MKRDLASYIDYSILKADATEDAVRAACSEAAALRVASLCVNSFYVGLCRELLRGSGVRVCTTVGFPLGASTSGSKACEAREATGRGADELDMVINVGALKSGNDTAVLEDLRAVREACPGRVLKVILETAYLTRDEKVRACLLAEKAGADFVKTSTGFGPSGATIEDVKLFRSTVPGLKVKAAGGIKTRDSMIAMIEAGADRIGTSYARVLLADGV